MPKITDTRGLGFHLLHLKGDTNFTEVLEGKEEKTESVMTMMTLLGKKIIFQNRMSSIVTMFNLFTTYAHLYHVCTHTHYMYIHCTHTGTSHVQINTACIHITITCIIKHVMDMYPYAVHRKKTGRMYTKC